MPKMSKMFNANLVTLLKIGAGKCNAIKVNAVVKMLPYPGNIVSLSLVISTLIGN